MATGSEKRQATPRKIYLIVLLDSNIFIYAVQSDYARLRQWIINKDITASEISRVEDLGYSQLTSEDTQDFEELFKLTKIPPVSRTVIDQAINSILELERTFYIYQGLYKSIMPFNFSQLLSHILCIVAFIHATIY